MKKTLLLALVPFLSGCGLAFVKGPAPGWQDASAEDLPSMAIQQPCTNSETLPMIDAALATATGVFGIVGLFASDAFKSDVPMILDDPPTGEFAGLVLPAQSTSEKALMYRSIAALVWTPVQAVSAVKGTQKVNDCKAFNARLFELREGGSSSLTSHEWLDELFPLPDLGVTGLDPVFGVPINQDH